jgi:dTDP-4-amino-4,6-dideoxy-D-galactose acyltransferase
VQIKIELLEWDSDFFGFRIGVVRIDNFNKAEISNLPEIMKSEGIKLIYIIMNEWDSANHELLLTINAKLVDKKTTYSKFLEPCNRKNSLTFPVVEFYKELFSSQFLDLAFDSGKYSRFLLDQGFGRKLFEKLYSEWLHKSIDGKLADKVWVALDEKKIVGFVTVKKSMENRTGQIGLIAVSENYRGKKIGHSLMSKCDEWYLENNLNFAKVVTQGDNIAASNFYETFGYKIEKIDYYYHLWSSV